MNIEDENILLGRLIHETSFSREVKNIQIDNIISIDFKKGKDNLIVFEIKKSSKLEEPVKWQLYYYLYYLKNKGIKAKGILVYPKEKKRKEIVLTKEIENEIIKIIKEIPRIVSLQNPPKPIKKPYCKRCSYYEFCWI